MKILQNETTNNTTTTSATPTAYSKDKQQHLPHPNPNSQSQQHTVEKRKAKTLKNKILQNVAKQQQQQDEHYEQQQRRKQHNEFAFNNHNTSSTMTDENIKAINNNNCNNTKSNNSNTADISGTTTTSSAPSTTLTDSIKYSSTTSSCANNNNNNSDLIIAEAAKILLKNGLNGTNAAAAAAVATATATLLTAAANFHQLPTVSNTISSTNSNLTTSTPTLISDTQTLAGNVTTAAAAAHAQLVAIAAAAAAVNATNQKRLAAPPTSTFITTTSSSTCKSPNQTVNNGLLDNIETPATSSPTTLSPPTVGASVTQFTKPYKTSSSKSTMSCSKDIGIFDYSVNLNSNNNNALTTLSLSSSSSSVINLSASANSNSNIGQQKYLNNIHSHCNRSDIGRPTIPHHHQTSNVSSRNVTSAGGYGGRLQFFKDGKFILELARSKEGDKEGWVSVPRKIFRTPLAATSSTITPSATAATSAAGIPSSFAASPAAVVSGTSYPKNECSNSLSFSDDNSSIQSSPWQRDHCWKQAAPRKNVSKELKLYYRRPAFHKFTTQALLMSYKKRRKPYDTRTIGNDIIFKFTTEEQFRQQKRKQQVDKSKFCKKAENEDHDRAGGVMSVKQNTEQEKAEINESKNNNNMVEEHDKSSDSNHIKTEIESVERKDVDIEMMKLPSPCKSNINKVVDCTNVLKEEKNKIDQIAKMNTSDCENVKESKFTRNSTQSNGNVSIEDLRLQKPQLSDAQEDFLKTGDEEKRLKKHDNYKTRAKLTTIVQKLIDVSTSRLAATAHLFKTSNQSATIPTSSSTLSTSSPSTSISTAVGAKNQNSKISPPSNTAASRLVEYHQQHVSPRKRILREFEKVSLEDNTFGASGGKRSRAKGNTTSTASFNSNASSQLPANSINKSMSVNTHNSNTAKPVTTAAPTKLYSSYSIHSLLGGGLSTSTVPSPPVKKSTDLPATITSNSMAYSFSSNSLVNNSPKSPERNNIGSGKSPSSSGNKPKRSPPYSSPMHESSSRSPITCINVGYADYSGRKSPKSAPETAHGGVNKLRYTSSGGADTTPSPTNHHLQQHHLQQHYQHQPQTYYSPYMMSPHYVPPQSGSNTLSPNAVSVSLATSTASSRSPRHHPSAFRAATPTSASSTTLNIPSTQKGDLSPQRSTTASPRETTPRTLPKKTASIRRQFASPTSATNQNHNNSNCSSPSTTAEEQITGDRRTPVNSNTLHHQQPQHLMQRVSPGNPSLSGSPVHPYSYLYAQPSNAGNSPHTSNVAGSNHASSTMSPSAVNASAAAAAAAAAASYIPAVVGSPYYHPYISTLAAMRHPQMWIQHYQSAAAAAATPALMQTRHPAVLSAAAAAGAAARLSPSYHGFQYNGVSNAAALAAAAAAAAAGFGGAATSPHPSSALSHPSSMFNPMVNSSLHSMQHPTTALQTAGLVPASAAAAALSAASQMTDTTDLCKSSKPHFSSNSSTSTLGVGNSSTSTGSSGSSIYSISIKDEQSSDVPLNLSKH